MRQTFLASAAIALLLLHAGPAFAINATQDTDGDGIPDVEEDANGNHTVDGGETDPYNADTDSGGESDGSEKAAQRNPLEHWSAGCFQPLPAESQPYLLV
jgi:hypothetical protein